jgi:hypothetical protein
VEGLMSKKKRKPYSRKHSPDLRPDPDIRNALVSRGGDSEIPCALAFEIAKRLGATPEEIGRTADMLDIPLAKCQLGLFGYKPKKKIIKAVDTADQELKNAVVESTDNGRLSCAVAWQIADRFNVSKSSIGDVCQANGIKLKDCRLGAF